MRNPPNRTLNYAHLWGIIERLEWRIDHGCVCDPGMQFKAGCCEQINIILPGHFEVSVHITCFINPLLGGRGYFGLWASCKTTTVNGAFLNTGVLSGTQSSAHRLLVQEKQSVSVGIPTSYLWVYSPHSIKNAALQDHLNNSEMCFTLVTAGGGVSYGSLSQRRGR